MVSTEGALMFISIVKAQSATRTPQRTHPENTWERWDCQSIETGQCTCTIFFSWWPAYNYSLGIIAVGLQCVNTHGRDQGLPLTPRNVRPRWGEGRGTCVTGTHVALGVLNPERVSLNPMASDPPKKLASQANRKFHTTIIRIILPTICNV